jgi:hypothetical protein
MPRKSAIVKTAGTLIILCAVVWSMVIVARSANAHAVTIRSAVLRNRVVVMDRIVMKKALYVAFSTASRRNNAGSRRAQGRLDHDGSVIAEAPLAGFQGTTGNLVFDLPYDLPEGSYTIAVTVLDAAGSSMASGTRTMPRSAFRNYITEAAVTAEAPLEEVPVPGEPEEVRPTEQDRSRGYIVFSRSPLAYVHRGSRPKQEEIVDHLSARTVRNTYATLTLALYPLRDLGDVEITVSDLQGEQGMLSRERMRIAVVEPVPDMTGMPQGTYRAMPTMLRPGNRAEVSKGSCQRFWITIRIDGRVPPQLYAGTVNIAPERGEVMSLPVRLTVEPVSLEDVPGVDYCMFMTYEFTELTMPWTKEEKEKIAAAAARVLRDYREHGMTTLCLHSPFVLITKEDGTPDLEDIFAALRTARDAGFTRPLVWYVGNLIQTAKPKHPGNINAFDAEVHPALLRYLTKTVAEYAHKHGCPEVIVLPIDEPDDAYQDVDKKRSAAAPLLVRTIKEAGAKSMITGQEYARFDGVDHFASTKLHPQSLSAAHARGGRYWIYDNKVTLDCTSPAYARYRYGYFTWKNGIDGMSSWTFQNTQNAGGPPGQANAPGRDIYLAYPSPSGPVATIKWEAIREGIDDHKLVYQLVKRITTLKNNGIDANRYEAFLDEIRRRGDDPCCGADTCREAEVAAFEQRRNAMISMIRDADRTLP